MPSLRNRNRPMARKKRTTAGDHPAPTGTLALDSIDMLKAIADPLRQKLLEQFAKHPATTKQVADRLGLKPTRLYHHVAKLERAGLIRLVETRPVRGTTEKYFSAVAGRLEIDRDAFAGGHGQQETAGMKIVESLFANVRQELTDLLADPAYTDGDTPTGAQQVVFAQTELCVDASTAAKMHDKVTALMVEFEAAAKLNPDSGTDDRKYRLIVGWYPRASES